MAIKKGYNFHQSFGLRQFLFISDSSGSNEISDVHLISSLKARQRVKVRHKTGWNICKIILGKVSKVVARQEKLVWSWNRFSAKEGASRSDQARPRTNMQVPTDTSCFEEKVFKDSHQTLDGRFGDGKSEAHGKFSAKEGVRPNQARPQTNIQVLPHRTYLSQFPLLLLVQPTGRAEGESETRDRQIICDFNWEDLQWQICKLKRKDKYLFNFGQEASTHVSLLFALLSPD